MKKKAQLIFIVVILALGLSVNQQIISAGNNVWTYAGLNGENVNSLAVDPISSTTVYAGTWNGVFKTSDGGANWSPANLGGPYFIYAVVIDPITSNNVYVAANAGVFKSTNNGTSWNRVNNTYAYSLAIDPVTSTTIYTGTSNNGVIKTTDGGASWNPASSGLPAVPIRSLAINPQVTSILYAGTDTGIYKSTDGGDNWNLANTGIPANLTYIYDLAIDPITPTTIYAGLYEFGIYKSVNGGETWMPANNGIPNPFNAYAHEIVIDSNNPNILHVGMSAGVFKSTDGSSNWTSMNSGLINQDIRSLVIDSSRTTIYAGSAGAGVFIWKTMASLTINYNNGSPGSFFTLTGVNFPPNSTALIIINGQSIDNIEVDEYGGFEFLVSTSQADEGRYFVTAKVSQNATTSFTLDSAAALRSQEGSGTIVNVPSGIAYTQFINLPLIQR